MCPLVRYYKLPVPERCLVNSCLIIGLVVKILWQAGLHLRGIKLFVKSGFRIRIHLIRIRIQHFRLNTDPDPDPIRIQDFYDQKLKKIYSWKNIFFFLDQRLQFTYP